MIQPLKSKDTSQNSKHPIMILTIIFPTSTVEANTIPLNWMELQRFIWYCYFRVQRCWLLVSLTYCWMMAADAVIDGGVEIVVIIGSNSVWFDGMQLLEQTMTELWN